MARYVFMVRSSRRPDGSWAPLLRAIDVNPRKVRPVAYRLKSTRNAGFASEREPAPRTRSATLVTVAPFHFMFAG